MQESLTYNDISLIPRNLSDIKSRDEVSTTTKFLGKELKLPILAAPMKTVCKAEMAIALHSLGGLGILARTNDFKKDLGEWNAVIQLGADAGVSIGVTGDYMERFMEYRKRGAEIFCLDTANGFNTNVQEAVMKMRFWDAMDKQENPNHERPLYIIAGNVGSVEGYEYLAYVNVDAVRVGIGNGSLCSTSIATGIGMGQVTLLKEIVEWRNKILQSPNDYLQMNPITGKTQLVKGLPAIIADGGIKEPGDICKALALGADVVMLGSMLAGTEQAPGGRVYQGGKDYKEYHGEASAASKGSDKYVEGASTLIPYKGNVDKITKSIEEGLRSSMSYMGCRTLDKFRNQPERNWIKLSHNSRVERTPHLLTR